MKYLEKRSVRLAFNAAVLAGGLIAVILVVGNGEIFPSSASLPAALAVLFSLFYLYASFDVLQPFYTNRTFHVTQQVLFFFFTALVYGLGLAQSSFSVAAETMRYSPWAISLPNALSFGSMLAIFLMQLFSNGKFAEKKYLTLFFFFLPFVTLFGCYLLFSALAHAKAVPYLAVIVGFVLAAVTILGIVAFCPPYKKTFWFYRPLYERRVKEAKLKKEYAKEQELKRERELFEEAVAEGTESFSRIEGTRAFDEKKCPVLTVEEFFDLVNRSFELMGEPFSYLSLEDPGSNAFLNSRRKDGEYCLTVDLRFCPKAGREGALADLAVKKFAPDAGTEEATWFSEKFGGFDFAELEKTEEEEGGDAAKKRVEKVLFGLWDSVSVFASYTLNPAPTVYEAGPYKAIKYLKIGFYYGF